MSKKVLTFYHITCSKLLLKGSELWCHNRSAEVAFKTVQTWGWEHVARIWILFYFSFCNQTAKNFEKHPSIELLNPPPEGWVHTEHVRRMSFIADTKKRPIPTSNSFPLPYSLCHLNTLLLWDFNNLHDHIAFGLAWFHHHLLHSML